jgi:N-acetylneuraminic acid mutarotase
MLHVVGGRPGALTAQEVYDPATDSWSDAAPLPLGRSSFAGAAVDGEFIVFGGEDAAETRVFTEVDVYDPASGRWTAAASLPHGVQGIGAAVVGDRVFVPGGGPTAGPADQSAQLLIFGP